MKKGSAETYINGVLILYAKKLGIPALVNIRIPHLQVRKKFAIVRKVNLQNTFKHLLDNG